MDERLSPRLAARAKLQKDPATGRWVLLLPEGLMNLNESARAILGLCDGSRNWLEILEKLSSLFKTPASLLEGDVRDLLKRMESKGLVEWVEPSIAPKRIEESPVQEPGDPENPVKFRPLGLLAELTYRCPLHCPYCSNPVWDGNTGKGGELTAEKWKEVLREARDLGVLHALFSGGEPLQRPDLEELVAHAHGLGLYTNLITSGLGLSEKRALALKEAGLDSVQLSFQASEESLADEIAGTCAHAKKLGAHRLELANTQYYGWAFRNRPKLLPTREQVMASSHVAEKARTRLKGKMEILYVIPDYFYERPKPCMNGWGRRYITVNPSGQVLPCPTAYSISSLKLENVREKSLAWIWKESESFNRFRGTQWMPEPCASCDLKEVDFGGCRCQAALLTGDPTVTDPACGLSPDRSKMEEALVEASKGSGSWDYRQNP
jgi:pyrroloquinoline quinone biosynthesis protein E